jgi:S1-C subfamily serine protease
VIGGITALALSVTGCGHLVVQPTSSGGGPGLTDDQHRAKQVPLDPAQLAALGDRVTPFVVDIDTELGYQNARGAGTGIVLSSDGEVLTNNHVINGATAITVTDLGDGRTYRADVLGYDRTEDLAVLRLDGASGLATATLGDSSQVAVNDAIAAVGNAGGQAGPPTLASGQVTALNRSVSPTDELTGASERLTGLIQVAAEVVPGDSGGPLVDRDGQVIGVDTAASTNYRYQANVGSGFAIPINTAVAVAHQIDSGQSSETVHVGATGSLGVQVLDAPRERTWRSSSGEPLGHGVPVAGVLLDSPADHAGLTDGDLLTSLDKNAVDSATALISILGHYHPGDRVTVGWVDVDGQRHSIATTLVAGPPA